MCVTSYILTSQHANTSRLTTKHAAPVAVVKPFKDNEGHMFAQCYCREHDDDLSAVPLVDLFDYDETLDEVSGRW